MIVTENNLSSKYLNLRKSRIAYSSMILNLSTTEKVCNFQVSGDKTVLTF